jgi:hypothetical protein
MVSPEEYYRFDVACHWCGSHRGSRRYGFQWVCVKCEERDVNGKLLPYNERWSNRGLWISQGGPSHEDHIDAFRPDPFSVKVDTGIPSTRVHQPADRFTRLLK